MSLKKLGYCNSGAAKRALPVKSTPASRRALCTKQIWLWLTYRISLIRTHTLNRTRPWIVRTGNLAWVWIWRECAHQQTLNNHIAIIIITCTNTWFWLLVVNSAKFFVVASSSLISLSRCLSWTLILALKKMIHRLKTTNQLFIFIPVFFVLLASYTVLDTIKMHAQSYRYAVDLIE